MISVDEALKVVLNSSGKMSNESIPLSHALNRILGEDVFSDRDYPPFNRAAMDGIAIRHSDYTQGVRIFKIVESIFPGAESNFPLHSGECYKIMTGAAVPKDADLVIRVEDLNIVDDRATVQVEQPLGGKNIAKQGEDLKKNEIVLKKGTKITPTVSALLGTVGKSSVLVSRQPKINIITTGNEIKKIGEPIRATEIRDSNSVFLISMLGSLGYSQVSLCSIEDSVADLEAGLTNGLKSDLLILTGGVSMGDADFIPEILSSLGVTKLFHKVAQKPGKPLWFGKKNDTVVFGLPGNPVSVQVMFKVYIEPILRSMTIESNYKPTLRPFLGEYTKKSRFKQFLPCKLTERGEVKLMEGYNGSGDIRTTAHSDGLLIVNEEKQEIVTGDFLPFIPW